MICPKCGEIIRYKARTCPACGEKLPRLSKEKKRSLKKDIIVFVIALLLIIAFTFIRNRNNGLLDIHAGDSAFVTKIKIGRLLPESEYMRNDCVHTEVYPNVYVGGRRGELCVDYIDGKVTGYRWLEFQVYYDYYYPNLDASEEDFKDNKRLYEIIEGRIASDGWNKVDEFKEDLEGKTIYYRWSSMWSNDNYPDKTLEIELGNKDSCGGIRIILK